MDPWYIRRFEKYSQGISGYPTPSPQRDPIVFAHVFAETQSHRTTASPPMGLAPLPPQREILDPPLGMNHCQFTSIVKEANNFTLYSQWNNGAGYWE